MHRPRWSQRCRASGLDLAVVGRTVARLIANDHWMMTQAMLLRLAYLGVTNALAMLRLLPMGDHDMAALLHRLPRDVLHHIRLLVRPDRVLR